MAKDKGSYGSINGGKAPDIKQGSNITDPPQTRTKDNTTPPYKG